MATQIFWHGHSNVQIIADDISVIIDPFFTGNPSCPIAWSDAPTPDIVLVTHDHIDHIGDAVELVKASGALCGCVVGTAEVLVEGGVRRNQIPATIGFNIGGTIEHKGVQITMTEALHTSETGVAVGYIITMPNGFTLYHAGDTGIFSNMELLGTLYPLDLACLPIGGFFTMDAKQAAAAVKLLNPKAVLPMHYKTFPRLAPNADDFIARTNTLMPDVQILAIQSGTSMTLSV